MHPSACSFRARFSWKLLLVLFLIGLGDWMFYQRTLYGGHFGFYAAALIIALVAGRPTVRRDTRALIAIAAALLFAAALVCDTSILAWSLCWVAATMAALLPATARFDDGWRWFQRLAWQALRGPFAPLIDGWRLLKIRRARRGKMRGMKTVLPVVALPLFGSAIILTLFSAANPLIAQLLSAIAFPELSFLGVLRVMLWIFLSVTAWGLLRPRLARRVLPPFDGRGDIGLPGVSVASVTLSLVAFNLLFALQNLLDIAYLWGLVPMPDGMTLADYAHRGAYPLIATALLAALFVLVTLRPGSTTANVPAIRKLVQAWIAQNIFLVGSSMLRTVDYIEAYSLTELRIAALAWMGLVAFGLAAICWRLLRDRSTGWLINVNLGAATLILTVASFTDLGAIAARWNVRHAREAGGKGVALDLCYLNRLGPSALLSLIELEQRAPLRPAFRERVQAVRLWRYNDLQWEQQHGGWTLRGQWRLDEAREALRHRRPVRLSIAERNCDGSIVPPPPPPKPAPTATRALTGETRK